MYLGQRSDLIQSKTTKILPQDNPQQQRLYGSSFGWNKITKVDQKQLQYWLGLHHHNALVFLSSRTSDDSDWTAEIESIGCLSTKSTLFHTT